MGRRDAGEAARQAVDEILGLVLVAAVSSAIARLASSSLSVS